MGLAATTTGFSTGRGLWSGSAGLSSGSGFTGGSGTDSAAAAYFAAVTAAGGTITPARQVLYNNFFTNLRSAGLLSLLDRLWIFTPENAAVAASVTAVLIDLISFVAATAVNSPTFTTNQGVAGDGAASYVNTNYDLTINSVQYALNSAHMSCYDRTSATTSTGSPTQFGSASIGFNLSSGIAIRPSASPSAFFHTNINGSTGASNATEANTQGYWITTRTGNSAASSAAYRNGAVVTLTTPAVAAGLPAGAVLVGAEMVGGVVQAFSADQIAAVSAGAGLTAVQASALTTAVNGFMTAINANVF